MNNQSSSNSVYDITIRMLILLLIVAWCLMIMYPFISIILWSMIIAMAIFPLHTKLAKKMGGRPKLASFIIIFSILIIVMLPSMFLIGSLIDEVKGLKTSYDNGTLTIPPPAEKVKEWPIIGEKVYTEWKSISVNLEKYISTHKDQLIDVGGKIAKGIFSAAGGLFQIIISLFIAGVLLAVGGVGESIRKFYRKVAGNRGDEFADLTLLTVGNVVKGILGESLAMAMLHGLVFLLAGVPYSGIWTFLIFILAALQLPVFLVTGPVILYIFGIKETMPAILWTISLVLVGFTDNILTPLFLGRGAKVPMLVIFIGVIGGFLLSGFIGLFTGAVVMSLGYTLFVSWINSNEIKAPES